MPVRVTAFGGEVLSTGGATTARVTAAGAEILSPGGPVTARVTAFGIEVLRTLGIKVTAFGAEVLRSIAVAPPSGQPAFMLTCTGEQFNRNEVAYGSLSLSGGNLGFSSVLEIHKAVKLRGTGGIFSSLMMHVYANTLDGGTPTTLRFRKNRTDGNMVISVPALATGWFEDAVNQDTAYDGETVSLRITAGSSSGSLHEIGVRGIACKFVPDSDKKAMLSQTNYSASPNQWYFSVPNTLTRYADLLDFQLAAMSVGTSSMNYLGGRLGVAAGTISNYAIYVASNGYTAGSVTSTLRHTNGVNGVPVSTGMSVSVPAGATGEFVDATNTFTFPNRTGLVPTYVDSVGTDGSGWFSVAYHSVTFDSDDGRHDLVAQGGGTNESADAYYSLVGTSYSLTESLAQQMVPFDLKWSNIRFFSNSAFSVAVTIRARINGQDGKQTIAMPANTSGWFEDTTNVDFLQKGDKVSIKATSTGNRVISAWGSTLQEVPRLDDASYIIIE